MRLEDVADVVLGADDYDQDVRFSGKKAVFMGVWVLPNANSLDVIGGVRDEIEPIQRELPTGMQAQVAYDSTAYINDAIHEVVKTLIETVLIVMVVIFLFLGSLRSVLVPVVAIPVSLIGARLPDAGVRLHAEPADAAGDRAVGRPGGRRRHRRGRERRAPHPRGARRRSRRRCSARASWSGRSSP